MTDLELLQQFEPIIRYTQGEMFFPAAVEPYVERASLWMRTPAGKDEQLAPPGALSLETLARYDEAPAGHTLYLNLVDAPLTGLDYQRWRTRPNRDKFQSAGRLARVPLFFRIFDSVLDFSFLVRGQVPGGFAAAAQVRYEDLCNTDPRRIYYGRVVRDNGWIVLHYLFFMTMNDWRSSFYGVNDHEADWEQVFVYVYEDEQGALEPQWVAYASHDFKGDDLRRRWDDPLLNKEGTHPIVYAGAGSHASYFEQGEYLVGIAPAFLKPVEQVAVRLRRLWYEQLRMGRADQTETGRQGPPLLSIPHIDYARGDGKSIGPGQPEPWTAIAIGDDTPWVDKYRGLWGLDTRDFVGGERAPSGPKYNRDGSVRQSWFDPLGWAGMDKVPTPPQILHKLQQRSAELDQHLEALDGRIVEQRRVVEELELDITSLRNSEYGGEIAKDKESTATVEHKALGAMQRERVVAVETIKSLQAMQRRIAAGKKSSPTAHLHAVHHPEPPLPPHGRIVDLWAALSGGVAVLAIAYLLLFRPPLWLAFVVVVGLALGAIEAATRGRLTNYLLTTVIILALTAGAILVIEFWQLIIALAIIAAVVFMVIDNLRELRNR